jgi:hypothetical protein
MKTGGHFGTMVTMRAPALLLCTLLMALGGSASPQNAAPHVSAVAPCPEVGYFRNCYGTYTWYDGSTYEGAWKDNQKTGFATYKDANGDSYVGEWKYNRRSGEGIYTWSDGRVWMGEWRDGEPHGRFIQYAPDKSVERMGIFQKGRLQTSKPVEPTVFARIRRYTEAPAAANTIAKPEPSATSQSAANTLPAVTPGAGVPLPRALSLSPESPALSAVNRAGATAAFAQRSSAIKIEEMYPPP